MNKFGMKISGGLNRGLRLGRKVAGHVKRIGEKVIPVARGILGLTQALGGGNSTVAKFVNAGNAAAGMGDRAVALSKRVMAVQDVGSGVSTVADKYGRAYKSMVQTGDATQAIGLMRDGVQQGRRIRNEVTSQAKSALQKIRRK